MQTHATIEKNVEVNVSYLAFHKVWSTPLSALLEGSTVGRTLDTRAGNAQCEYREQSRLPCSSPQVPYHFSGTTGSWLVSLTLYSALELCKQSSNCTASLLTYWPWASSTYRTGYTSFAKLSRAFHDLAPGSSPATPFHSGVIHSSHLERTGVSQQLTGFFLPSSLAWMSPPLKPSFSSSESVRLLEVAKSFPYRLAPKLRHTVPGLLAPRWARRW